MRELFQEEGYNVTTTNFAPNSFQQIEALQPDALIIDIAIGQEAGWELLEQLGADADTAGIPALVLSTDPRLLARAEAQASPLRHAPLSGQAARPGCHAGGYPGDDWNYLSHGWSVDRERLNSWIWARHAACEQEGTAGGRHAPRSR